MFKIVYLVDNSKALDKKWNPDNDLRGIVNNFFMFE